MAKLTSAATVNKPAVTKAKPTLIRSSDELAIERYRMTTHGGPGHGKTFFAATASNYWPKVTPTKNAKLDDMLWIAFDAGAVVGFRELGIRIDNVIDVRWLMTPAKKGEEKPYARTILDALNMVIAETASQVSNGDIKWVVVDTVSMLDKALNDYWEKNCPSTKSGSKDKFTMYRCIQYSHRMFHEAMQLLDCHVHFLCHTKARIEAAPGEDDQKNRQKAAALPGDNDLIPDITGGGAAIYTANVSVEFALVSTKQVGGGFKRVVMPTGGKGYRGKNRWQHSLGDEEQADLGAIVRKIEAAQ